MTVKKNGKGRRQSDSPEQVSAAEALERMKTFNKRKEKFIAAVKKSKDRNIHSAKRQR